MSRVGALAAVCVLLFAYFAFTSVSALATEDSWVSKTPLPIYVKDVSAIAVDGKIYALGYNYSSFNYLYDPATDTWVSKTPMPQNQSQFALATYQNKIYVIGGWLHIETETMATSSLTGTTQVYDIATDSWETKAPLQSARADIQAASMLDGKIYVFGGQVHAGKTSAATFVYDIEADTWESLSSMPTPTSNYACAELNGKIYVLGGGRGGAGGSASDAVQIYDPKTNNWTQDNPLPIAAGDATAAVIYPNSTNPQLYLTGTPNQYFDQNSNVTTQIYNPQTQNWTNGSSIPAPNFVKISIVNINQTLFAVGGNPFAYGAIPGLYPTVNQQYFPPQNPQLTPTSTVTTLPTTTPTLSLIPAPSASETPSPFTSSPQPTKLFADELVYGLVVAAAVVVVLGLVMVLRKRVKLI